MTNTLTEQEILFLNSHFDNVYPKKEPFHGPLKSKIFEVAEELGIKRLMIFFDRAPSSAKDTWCEYLERLLETRNVYDYTFIMYVWEVIITPKRQPLIKIPPKKAVTLWINKITAR